jgi:hypothetical protein
MKNIVVDKERLVSALRESRDKHEREYQEAYDGFVKKYADLLKKKIGKAEAGAEIGPRDTYIDLEVPENHTEDYTRALDMLSWHEGDSIDLSTQEYKNYIEDDWAWTGKFRKDLSSYTVIS